MTNRVHNQEQFWNFDTLRDYCNYSLHIQRQMTITQKKYIGYYKIILIFNFCEYFFCKYLGKEKKRVEMGDITKKWSYRFFLRLVVDKFMNTLKLVPVKWSKNCKK